MLPNDELDSGDDPYAEPFYSPDEYLETEKLRPFRTVWTRPRETVRKVVAQNPSLHIGLIALFGGIDRALDKAPDRNLENSLELTIYLVIAVVFGPVGFLVSLWIGTHLLRFTGKWIGGVATREHLTAACVWGWVPIAFTLLLWIPKVALFGSEAFTEDIVPFDAAPVDAFPLSDLAFLAICLAEMILAIWGMVLLSNTVAEVQGFRSAWAGFGNLTLAWLTCLIPIMAAVFGWLFLFQN